MYSVVPVCFGMVVLRRSQVLLTDSWEMGVVCWMVVEPVFVGERGGSPTRWRFQSFPPMVLDRVAERWCPVFGRWHVWEVCAMCTSNPCDQQ